MVSRYGGLELPGGFAYSYIIFAREILALLLFLALPLGRSLPPPSYRLPFISSPFRRDPIRSASFFRPGAPVDLEALHVHHTRSTGVRELTKPSQQRDLLAIGFVKIDG